MRLRWARGRRYGSAAAFAAEMGMQRNTYTAYERPPGSSKWTAMTFDKASAFARKLGVRWEWLYFGEGTPHPSRHGAVGEDRRGRLEEMFDGLEDEEQEAVLTIVESIAKRKAG